MSTQGCIFSLFLSFSLSLFLSFSLSLFQALFQPHSSCESGTATRTLSSVFCGGIVLRPREFCCGGIVLSYRELYFCCGLGGIVSRIVLRSWWSGAGRCFLELITEVLVGVCRLRWKAGESWSCAAAWPHMQWRRKVESQIPTPMLDGA